MPIGFLLFASYHCERVAKLQQSVPGLLQPFADESVNVYDMQGFGVINKLSDSVLYQPTASWARWRVDNDHKPSDTRRKYRGIGL